MSQRNRRALGTCRNCHRDYLSPAAPGKMAMDVCSRPGGCAQLATKLRHRARMRAYGKLVRRHLDEWREIYGAEVARAIAEAFPDPGGSDRSAAADRPARTAEV